MRYNIRGLQHHLEATEESAAILKILLEGRKMSAKELKERLSLSPGTFLSCITKLSRYEILEHDKVKEKINGKQVYTSYWSVKPELMPIVKRYVGGDIT